MIRMLLLLVLSSLPGLALHAQTLEINPISGSAAALPIAVVPFDYLGAQVAPDTDIAAVIRADLNRSGSFRTLGMIVGPVFDRIASSLVDAFVQRADEQYGA